VYATAVLISAALLGGTARARADIVNGVDMPGHSPAPASPSPHVITPPPSGTTLINFDDRTAPCLFLQTVPLTTEYSSLGVVFSGPSSGSGGAVLNECGAFSVTSYSHPNFLAFNNTAVYSGGGVPAGPETLAFANSVNYVQLNAGHTGGGTITLSCFNGNALLGQASILSGTAVSTLSVQATGITRCTVDFTGQFLVVDDLAFGQVAGVPTLDAGMLAALAAALALLALMRMKSA
jgi:hypothetical protein